MTKDWTGNTSIYACNHRTKEEDVAENDFYATHPESVQLFLKKCKERNFKLPNKIWECAVGQGHIAKELVAEGYDVLGTDLVDRGYGKGEIDFLQLNKEDLRDEWKPYLKCIFTNPPYACFSIDTEIKTKRGWKYFKELTADDQVLSLNPKTQCLEWSTISNFHLYDIEDELIHFNSAMIDVLVTKNHRMYAFDKSNILKLKDNDLIHAEYIKKRYYIPRFGYNWNGNLVKTFILNGCYVSNGQRDIWQDNISIDMNAWLEFFGLWLADGYCRHTMNPAGNKRFTVGIKQADETRDRVIQILNNLPFKWKEYRDGTKANFEIHSKQLWLYLSQFGTSSTKFIPQEIKDLCIQQLSIFLDSYTFGDSSKIKVKTEGMILSSISIKLIEDIHEILLKLGYLGHISKRSYGTDNKLLYSISYMPNKLTNRTIHYGKKEYIPYKGQVFCLTLAKNGVFLLRRNGKEFFSGNSACAFVEKALELLDSDGICIMFLKTTFLETKGRLDLFKNRKLKYVWQYVNRQGCGKNGGTFKNGGAAAYAMFIWDNSYNGLPELDWII